MPLFSLPIKDLIIFFIPNKLKKHSDFCYNKRNIKINISVSRKPADQKIIAPVQLAPDTQAEAQSYLWEQEAGVKFLRRKFTDLHKSPEVAAAAKRTKVKTGEPVAQSPEAHIANYLHRFREILDRKDEGRRQRGIEALRKIVHREFVIKPEDIPESYFEKQEQIAQQFDHDEIEMTEEAKNRLTKTVIADQKFTLNNWINYLTSRDAEVYPDWCRYWAFRSMLSLSTYDKKKKQFGKRKKDTVAPFPDLNREALAYVVDIIIKKAKGEHVVVNEDNPELQKLVQSENFARLYAYAIESVTPTEASELEQTQGEWVTYKQGSDHMPLVKALQGHGTCWCTAGESTAEAQLKTGDFHVYYSFDREGKPTIPRIAIRMQAGAIAEVRGIAFEQNLDPYVTEIAEKKLAEFPDGPIYHKKLADMKRLTSLENRRNRGEEFAPDELRFLYELDSRIESFGYVDDKRINGIRVGRNIKKDYATIYGIREDQVIDDLKELNSEVRAYIGSETYTAPRNSTLEQIELLSKVNRLTTDLTDVNTDIKAKLTNWQGTIIDNGEAVLYPQLHTIGGYFNAPNATSFDVALTFPLEARLTSKPGHYKRPEGIDISAIKKACEAHPNVMKSLLRMELSGGAPDIIAETDDAYIFGDCSAQPPLFSRALEYNQAVQVAQRFGVKLMDENTYRNFQKNGQFDDGFTTWLETPAEIRGSGEALRGGRYAGRVFVMRDPVDMYDEEDGWRGMLKVPKK